MNIGIIGIGRLGLCFALSLEKAGFNVIGVDIDVNYVNNLNNEHILSYEPGVMESLQSANNFKATSELKDILESGINMIFVFVATPSLSNGKFDHSQIDSIVIQLIHFGKRISPVEIVIGCTTMPGYCDEINEKLRYYNYKVSYSPEFIAQGSIMNDLIQPDQVIIGEADIQSGDAIQNIYEKICVNQPAISRMDRLSAEITKLATNCFLTMKISFANSIGDLAIKSGADPNKILKAIGSDSRIGNKYLKYGFGFGGPCFPRDNQALLYFAEQKDHHLDLSKATIAINKEHLAFQLKKMLDEDNDEYEFDYITYKKNTDILEESQQLLLAIELVRAGKKVILKNSENIKNRIEQVYPNCFHFL